MKADNNRQRTSNPIPKKTALYLKGIQLLSPFAGYRMAKKLFFIPRTFPTPEREQAYKHSSIVSREKVNEKRITVYQLGTSKRKVLLVHGWSGRATQFFRIAPALEKAGYKVYSFTAPAHGTSNDKETHMLEFADCIKHLVSMHGPFEAIVAHSIGAAAALNAVNQGVNAKKIVALGAPGYIKDIVTDFCATFKFNKKVENRLYNELKKRFGGDIEKFSATELAAHTPAEGLIIHDTQDVDVDVEAARRNHKAWKNSTYIETTGLGHQRILTDADTIKKIVEFLA